MSKVKPQDLISFEIANEIEEKRNGEDVTFPGGQVFIVKKNPSGWVAGTFFDNKEHIFNQKFIKSQFQNANILSVRLRPPHEVVSDE